MKKRDFLQSLNDLENLLKTVGGLYSKIEEASAVITKAINAKNKLMICGNGGSAADAQHMAAEFVNRFLKERAPLAAIALSTDTSNITSIANDYSFDEIFSKQVEALGINGDVLLGISTSGNSNNVIKAFEAAKLSGIYTIGLLGKDGGELARLSDLSIIVNSNSTPRIQEAHIFIIHTVCQMVEDRFAD